MVPKPQTPNLQPQNPKPQTLIMSLGLERHQWSLALARPHGRECRSRRDLVLNEKYAATTSREVRTRCRFGCCIHVVSAGKSVPR